MNTPLTQAQIVALTDDAAAHRRTGRAFSEGVRPVIRWIKGDGHDDDVTRAAIGQATRLFGDRVDYCLCSVGIDAPRARRILEWAEQPVEWWPVGEADNPALASALRQAGCPPERFGYWWKWFPERVRPQAPEWIFDGDMVVVGPPEWFDAWVAGTDDVRVTQDDRWPADALYGRYRDMVDPATRLYSGLISLPPDLSYMPAILDVLAMRPLDPGHDGIDNICEQGVVAAAFGALRAHPIPLSDFPLARAFEPELDFGQRGDRGTVWGYHFGHAFRGPNHHFGRLVTEGIVLHLARRPSLSDRLRWLGGAGQWGVPGWGSSGSIRALVEHYARPFAGKRVLELGTSRGAMTALLASVGGKVTGLDRHDRGAAVNLAGLDCTIVQADATDFLARAAPRCFDLIVSDLHGNSEAEWRKLWPLIEAALAPGGLVLLCNATLSRIPQWRAEDGIPWVLGALGAAWQSRLHAEHLPGLAVLHAPGGVMAMPAPPAPLDQGLSARLSPAPTAAAPAMARSARLTPVLPQPFRPKRGLRPGGLRRTATLAASLFVRAAHGVQIIVNDYRSKKLGAAARLRRIQHSTTPGTQRSLCLYAHYAKHGRVSPMVLLQLREYARLGFRIIFVTNAPRLPEADWLALAEIVDVAALRDNFGFDFGAWSDAAQCLLPDADAWDEILLANDSVVGPITPLDPVFARLRGAGEGVFGLTEGVQLGAHLQSYFILARGAGAGATVLDFLRAIRLSNSKRLTIRRGEIGLTEHVRHAGVPVSALHSYADLERAAATSPVMREGLAAILPHIVREIGASGRQLVLRRALMDVPLNPTHHFAILLVRVLGFPFLKTELLLANPVRHPEALDWQDLVPPGAPCSADMVHEHLALQLAGVAAPSAAVVPGG